jgi:hypothetical protein
MISTRRMPPLSVASSVTTSEPEREPPASRPEASIDAAGRVGSLRTTCAPESRCETPPPAATEHAVLTVPSKQPTAICSVVAVPA